MRRKDREITDSELITQVITNAQVCRLGLAQDNVPYVVPVSFGYDGQALYFHTAPEGRKLDYLRANSTVCFEFEHGVELVPSGQDPCEWSFHYQSVIGYGHAVELLDATDKIAGLKQIVAQYSNRDWECNETMLKGLRVWKIAIESMTGKQSPADLTR
jgi:nitroimidazol reductase NimA-like FMN-containing flavoprotein (pyridoxamine 5'-phosphate oxidase superfamily)